MTTYRTFGKVWTPPVTRQYNTHVEGMARPYRSAFPRRGRVDIKIEGDTSGFEAAIDEAVGRLADAAAVPRRFLEGNWKF